jgi:2-polyprenyl-3-methyl-5-hydroxy-6-metoxy-1,4-benzoquinol methylase
MFQSNKRSELQEIMDQPNLDAKDIEFALYDISKVNKYLGGYSVILDALEKLKWKDKNLSILDVGSGGGDTLRVIADWAKNKKINISLTGIDINPVMTNYAKVQSVAYSNIDFKTYNFFDDTLLDMKYDVVMCNLFCHHFDKNELVKLIIRMKVICKSFVIVNDIHRHWFAYYSIKFITKLFSKSYMVKYDAPLSVARSLSRNEWNEILSLSGVSNAKMKWCWAWRWQIIIKK